MRSSAEDLRMQRKERSLKSQGLHTPKTPIMNQAQI